MLVELTSDEFNSFSSKHKNSIFCIIKDKVWEKVF